MKQFSPAGATICVVLSSGRYRTCSVFPYYKMGRKCVNLQEDEELALAIFKYPCLWMKTDPAYKDSQTAKPNAWRAVEQLLGAEQGTAASTCCPAVPLFRCPQCKEGISPDEAIQTLFDSKIIQ